MSERGSTALEKLRQQLQALTKEVGSTTALQVCFPVGLPSVPVCGPKYDIWRKPSPVVNAR